MAALRCPGPATSSSRSVGSASWSHSFLTTGPPACLPLGCPPHTKTCVLSTARASKESEQANCTSSPQEVSRRDVVWGSSAAALSLVVGTVGGSGSALAADGEFTDMPALRGKDYGKSRMKYPDYVETPSGLQYKDLREGTGPPPKEGDTVVIDWDGFTIGYYGRIFEARNKAKGGSFEGGEKDFYRFVVGANQVIPAFEEAIATMSVGQVRRIVVPPEIGYPNNDFNKSGPRPNTFSGQRALDFVLKNQGLIDKTLLFDIELMKIVPS